MHTTSPFPCGATDKCDTPYNILALLLDSVASIHQSDDWAEDFRTASHLLTPKHRMDLIIRASARRFHIASGSQAA